MFVTHYILYFNYIILYDVLLYYCATCCIKLCFPLFFQPNSWNVFDNKNKRNDPRGRRAVCLLSIGVQWRHTCHSSTCLCRILDLTLGDEKNLTSSTMSRRMFLFCLLVFFHYWASVIQGNFIYFLINFRCCCC
jgi:hypothetical protein